MALISITIGEDLIVQGPLMEGGCISISSTAYLGEGPNKFIYARDTVNFHATLETFRSFAEKLLASLPEPATQVEEVATEVEAL